MTSRLDSVFTPELNALDVPFAGDRPMISRSFIARSLDAIEAPLASDQAVILQAETEGLLDRALPLIAAKNLSGVLALTWNAELRLQRPIYSLWADGYELGGQHMQAEVLKSIPKRERAQYSGASYSGVPERFALSADVSRLLASFLALDPGQIVASSAKAAVLSRVVQLAGNFGRSQLDDVKQHLMAAIVPQAGTGDPIGRRELLSRIESTLNVGRVRADNIARTELTSAYNVGRVEMGKRSSLVEAFRFLAISDNRTTPICNSRNGMIIPAGDTDLLNANTPALHFRCRSTLSPIMPRVNAAHRGFIADASRRAENRQLVALMPGWNGGRAEKIASKTASEQAREAAIARAQKRAEERARKRAADDAKRAAAAKKAAETARSSQATDTQFISEYSQRASGLRQEKREMLAQFRAGSLNITEVSERVKALEQQAKAQTQELAQALADRLSAQSSQPMSIRQHGMMNFEQLRRSRFGGLDFYAEGFDPNSTPVQSLVRMVEDGWFPEELNRHTEGIVFSAQRNSKDDYWAVKYNTPNFVSAATGGDGKVVVYGGRTLSHSSMAHEMGHNLAKGRYGTTQTAEGSDFWSLAQSSTAPTAYGTNSISEDFAESVKLYVQHENGIASAQEFKKEHPERYSIIDRLIKEIDYDG